VAVAVVAVVVATIGGAIGHRHLTVVVLVDVGRQVASERRMPDTE